MCDFLYFISCARRQCQAALCVCSWIFQCVKWVTDAGLSMSLANLSTWTRTQSSTFTSMRCLIRWPSGRNKLDKTAVFWVIEILFFYLIVSWCHWWNMNEYEASDSLCLSAVHSVFTGCVYWVTSVLTNICAWNKLPRKTGLLIRLDHHGMAITCWGFWSLVSWIYPLLYTSVNNFLD